MSLISCGNNSSGCLTELAAIGNQDAYLTINPEVTFFKQLYRRHTNFAMCEADIGFQSAIGHDRRLVAVVPRNGDLITKMFIATRLERLSLRPGAVDDQQNALLATTSVLHHTNAVGQALFPRICFEIGGQIVDSVTGAFLQIWEQFEQGLKPQGEMIGQFDNVDDLRDFAAREHNMYTFLPFYFSKHYELAVPLIALQYHEVKVIVDTAVRDLMVVGFAPGPNPGDPDFAIPATDILGGALLDLTILVHYVYLDTQERRIQAQQPHEFLITQLQLACTESVPAGSTQRNVTLHPNHPVIEMFWTYQELPQRQFPFKRFFNFGINDPEGLYPWQAAGSQIPLVDPFATVALHLNGHTRFGPRTANYFRLVQPYLHHANLPDRFIYNYAFGLWPGDDKRPTGSLNFSRIDNVQLCFVFLALDGVSALVEEGELIVYFRNFNVKKIAGGMAAIRHAN